MIRALEKLMNLSHLGRRLAVALAVALPLALPPAAGAAEFGVALEGGYRDLTSAPDSADALFGSRGGLTFGASLRVGLGRSFFARATARAFQKEGERVFVGPGGTVFPLGHPLTLRMVPVFGMVGYRFNPEGTLVPYVGLGAGATMVEEESEIGGEVTSISTTKFSGHVAAGVEYGRGTFRFGGELGWATVPDAIGATPSSLGSVSAHYGESDLGGFSAVARIVIVP